MRYRKGKFFASFSVGRDYNRFGFQPCVSMQLAYLHTPAPAGEMNLFWKNYWGFVFYFNLFDWMDLVLRRKVIRFWDIKNAIIRLWDPEFRGVLLDRDLEKNKFFVSVVLPVCRKIPNRYFEFTYPVKILPGFRLHILWRKISSRWKKEVSAVSDGN